MFTKRNFSFFGLLAATLLLAVTAFAQTATITGTVTDAKDALAGSPENQVGPARSAFCTRDQGCTSPIGVPGNTGRNHFVSPRISRSDAVVSKDTSITERVKLELRLEAFNVFNHVEFAQPGNALQDPANFGFTFSTLGQPDGTTTARQLQVGVKLKF